MGLSPKSFTDFYFYPCSSVVRKRAQLSILEACPEALNEKMSTALKMEVNPQEIIEAVRKMKQQDREEFLEKLLAATCPEYLASIR